MKIILATMLPYLVELGAASFLLLFFAFITWTKVALGAALTVVGAFFPHSTSDKATGTGALKIGGASITLKGSLRVGVVLAGIALVINEGIDTSQKTKKYKGAADESATAIENLFGVRAKNGGTLKSLSHEARVEKLTELRSTLSYMQSAKPDQQISKILSSVDTVLQQEIASIEMNRAVEEALKAPKSASVNEK